MKVLVCGGRDFDNRKLLFKVLDEVHREIEIILIIEGAEPNGADTLASDWASKRCIANFRVPAQWKKYGKAAGPIRNKAMLERGTPDLVIAFPGNDGTKDMVKQAKKAGIEVMAVKAHGKEYWLQSI